MPTTFAPTSIEVFPEINQVLGSLNLGELKDCDVTAFGGRNENWAGITSTGSPVFVKRVRGELARQQIQRSVGFDEAVGLAGRTELLSPRLLGHDEEARLVVTDLLREAPNGAELFVEGRFDEDLAHRAGRAVGLLHATDADSLRDRPDTTEPWLPNPALNEAVPLRAYLHFTMAEVTFWRIIHADPALCEAVERLRERERTAPRCPVHCDVRLDQFLLHEGRLYLIDGEEFRLADPARDVGAFIGDCLHHALRTLSACDEEPSHDALVERGTRELTRTRPALSAFWAGYRSAYGEVDPELAVRAVAFAGWQLIDRALALAGMASRLGATARAAMGIGRTALLDPERYVAAMGLGRPA
jgi:hypothetical protein